MQKPIPAETPAPRPPAIAGSLPWYRHALVVVPVLLLLSALALPALWYCEQVELLSPANAFVSMFSTVGGTVIVLLDWFVFLSPAPRRIRRRVGLTMLALFVALPIAFRIEGVSGDLKVRLAFRWSPKADQVLPPVPARAGGVADLRRQSDTDYPGFLGRDRRATIEGIKLARDWSAQAPRPLWRHAIGAGWSAFAVAGQAAVTQEQRGDQELITCYDVMTGNLLWSYAEHVRYTSKLGGDGPRATPTIDDGRVYAIGATGRLNCLDGSSGRKIWHEDVISENEIPIYGVSCSPLVIGQRVIVTAGGLDKKSLVAFDKRSGRRTWSGGTDRAGYASPVLMALAGEPQIVVVGATSIAGHDPADGHVLWSHEWPSDQPSVSQPVAVGDDRLFASKGYGVGCKLWQIQHSPQGDWSVGRIWENKNLKTKFTNVVVRDGCVFGLDEGILACLDLKTGDRRWKQGRYGHGQILLVDDLILVQAELGEVALVEASPDHYRELGRFPALNDKTWNNPALSGQHLLVRNAEEAACYELPLANK